MTDGERFYRLLLNLYPREYRRQYGKLMVIHFRDQLRAARKEGAVTGFWLRTLLDVARTAPLEQIEALQTGRMGTWVQVLLVIAPVALVLLLVPPDDGAGRIVLLGLAVAYVILLIVSARRQWPVAWAFPLLGLAGTYAVMWGSYFFFAQWRWLGQNVLYPHFFLLVGLALLLRPILRLGKRLTVALLGMMLVASAFVILVQGDASVVAVSEAVEAPALIVLAGVLGLPIARRYGLPGALFVVGSLQWAVETTIDPSLQIRFGEWSLLLSLLIVGTTLIAIPLLVLRARSDRGRVVAMLAPLAACLGWLVLLPLFVYRFSPLTAGAVETPALVGQALRNGAYAVQIVAGMGFVVSLYRGVGSVGSEPRVVRSATHCSADSA